MELICFLIFPHCDCKSTLGIPSEDNIPVSDFVDNDSSIGVAFVLSKTGRSRPE